MDYRILGRTGIKVSAIGLGGEGFENKIYEDCEAMIDCAMKQVLILLISIIQILKSEVMSVKP